MRGDTRDAKVELAPAYDFLSTTIALKNAKEELALPLNGKKSKLTRRDLLGYYGRERLRINDVVLNDVIARFAKALPVWRDLLGRSFPPEAAKLRYAVILGDRQNKMKL